MQFHVQLWYYTLTNGNFMLAVGFHIHCWHLHTWLCLHTQQWHLHTTRCWHLPTWLWFCTLSDVVCMPSCGLALDPAPQELPSLWCSLSAMMLVQMPATKLPQSAHLGLAVIPAHGSPGHPRNDARPEVLQSGSETDRQHSCRPTQSHHGQESPCPTSTGQVIP